MALNSGEWFFRFFILDRHFIVRSTLTSGPNFRGHLLVLDQINRQGTIGAVDFHELCGGLIVVLVDANHQKFGDCIIRATARPPSQKNRRIARVITRQ